MEQKERLIDLILSTPKIKFPFGSRLQGKTYQTAGNMADHLLANGVIVPPCKVGDTVYMPWVWSGETRGVAILTVTHVIIDELHSYIRTNLNSDSAKFMNAYNYGKFDFKQFGEKVFTSKQEAAKALEKLIAERSEE